MKTLRQEFEEMVKGIDGMDAKGIEILESLFMGGAAACITLQAQALHSEGTREERLARGKKIIREVAEYAHQAATKGYKPNEVNP